MTYFSHLTSQLAEYGNAVLTCAGRGHVMEVMFSLIGDLLPPYERAETANHLMIQGACGFHWQQPKGQAQGNTFLEGPL